MFEMIVTYLNHLRNVSEFPSIWLRFVSVLANNVNVVQKNAALHEEVLEMIVALLRLLHPPALPSSVREAVNSPTLSKSNSTSQNSFLGLLASAIFDEPKQEQPLSPLTVISPNIHNKTPLSGGGVTGDGERFNRSANPPQHLPVPGCEGCGGCSGRHLKINRRFRI
jgi:hypothetical protein